MNRYKVIGHSSVEEKAIVDEILNNREWQQIEECLDYIRAEVKNQLNKGVYFGLINELVEINLCSLRF